MPDSLKQKAAKGVLWSTIERFSVQGVQFLIMIVMARLLTPHDYGIIGMLAIFIAVAQSLIDSGFSQALIRKQNRTETDNNTVFYFNIVVSGLLYFILYISAPFVADFYNTPQLCPVMRVVCISIIFNSLAVVQRALLTIKIDFKTQAKAALTAAVTSGVVGITMAYHGFGVWSLVTQQLLNLGINTSLLWLGGGAVVKVETTIDIFLAIISRIVRLWLEAPCIRTARYHLSQHLSHCYRQAFQCLKPGTLYSRTSVL